MIYLHRQPKGWPSRYTLGQPPALGVVASMMMNREEAIMLQGSKVKYTDKQKRKAGHIEDACKAKGIPEPEAEARAWATVNAQDGGGKKSGSGRKRSA